MVRFDPARVKALVKQGGAYTGLKGSIVRLKLIDFMTYSKIELRAGKSINLILGPNGTGKSTIVCAICIGLAGKQKILGRANSLKEYIRHGCNAASVEIELYNPDGLNFVVKRSIKGITGRRNKKRRESRDLDINTGAKSTWFLNGSKVQPAAIEKLLNTLNIQLDNLCQFLPQDRVHEFSKMDSYTLLRSTQEALGKSQLTEKHDMLLNYNDIVKKLEHSLKNADSVINMKQQQLGRLQRDVTNHLEREAMKKRVDELTGKKAWFVYLKKLNLFRESRAKLTAIKEKKQEEERQLEPMRKAVQLMESKLVKYRQELNKVRSENVSMSSSIKRKYEEECDHIEIKISKITTELEIKEKEEKGRIKRYEAACAKYDALKREVDELDLRADLDDGKLQAELRKYKNITTNLSGKIFELEAGISENEVELRSLDYKIAENYKQLMSLDDHDIRVSRLKFLQREYRDVYLAVEYLQNPSNRQQFIGEVHEPFILNTCIKDLKYGGHIERAMGIDSMVAIMVEHEDDLEAVLNVAKVHGWRVNVTHFRPQKNFQRPKGTVPDNLKRYDFKYSLIDLILAPDYYLNYFVDKLGFASAFVGTDKTEGYMNSILEKTNLRYWFTEKTHVSVKKSNYNGGYKCTTTGFIRGARIFTTQINAAEKDQLEDMLKQLKEKRVKVEQSKRTKQPELERLLQERQEAEIELKDVQAKISHKLQLKAKLEGAQVARDKLAKGDVSLEKFKQKAKKEIQTERLKPVGMMEWATNALEQNATKGQNFLILKRQVSWLQSRIITKQNTLDEMEANIKQYNGEINRLNEETKVRADDADSAKKEATSKSQLREPPSDVANGEVTEDELAKECADVTIQMSFLAEMQPSIVKDLENITKECEVLTRERDIKLDTLVQKRAQIDSVKSEWLTSLGRLVGRINLNFGRFFASMGCAGEVSLKKEDENDFGKYGIKIMVKFRASEPLSEMCGGRGSQQSGGERMITTALYLLALQELTVVPFRVIDEINQGMDTKNEARFFNLLCLLTKTEGTPQYFLLSPRMLPEVEYPDHVTFHIIMNGPKVYVRSVEDKTSDDADDDSSDSDSD